MFYQKIQKRQNTELQNQFYLGGVHGEPRFPRPQINKCVKLLRKVTHLNV
jgi:hypothetical protein